MLPYQSPIKPYQASTSDVPVPSPSKISKLPISLHGLFGEANSLDDPISLPFIVQSPPCGSSYGSKNSPSPHKSPGSVVNSHQQPVLLSELTDCSLLESNQINGIYQKNTLCSYVSTYDNRRCTNSATANCNNGKTYCGKHLHLVNNPPVHIAANVRGQLKKAEQLHKKIAPMSYSPCITKLSFQHVEEPQSITLNSLNEGPYLTSASDKDTSVIDLTDGSYSYIPTRGEEVRVNKSTHSHPSVNNKTQSNIASTARSNYHSSPSISFTPKVLSRPKHPAVSMDGDVLQAVVDLLNQNHDQLTSKQQIELLNSLGVAVATIQSPAQSSTDIPYRTTYCNQTTKPSNYTTQSMASMRRKVIPVTQTTVSGTLPSPSCQSKTAQKLPPVIVNAVSTVNTPTKPELGTKRPNSEPIEKPQNKKRKKAEKSSTNSNLRSLSSVELDKQVSKALASIRQPVSSKIQVATVKIEKATPPAAQIKVKNANACLTPPLPSVSLPINHKFQSDKLNLNIKCQQLQEYVNLQREKVLQGESLFCDLFCDDKDYDLCTCKNLNFKRETQKSKKKTQKNVTKYKLVCKCNKGSQKYLKKYLKEKKLKHSIQINSSVEDYWMLSKPDFSENSVTSFTNDTKENHTKQINFCHKKLDTSRKRWQKLLKDEKKSLELLTASVATDASETAKVLRSMGVRPISCSRRRGACASKPTMCKLADGNGKTCINTALPLSPYCRNHIWHSEHQVLYKLNQGMKAVADITPDPVVIRPRKKTKLPPLSKRKKRRSKRGKGKKVPTIKTKPKNTTSNESPSAKSFQTVNGTCKVMTNHVPHITKFNTLHPNSSPNNDSSDKIDVDSLPNEDSTSGMFESLLGESHLLEDVIPEMFKEFGQSSEVLDNALMLASAVHSDGPEKLNIDKLSFDDLNESNVFLSSNHEVEDILASRNELDNIYIQNSIESPNMTSQEDPGLLNSMFLSQPSTESVYSDTKWPEPQFTSSVDVDLGDVSSSLDSSFADDLHELEGVIRSLQDETESHASTARTSRMHTMNADEYTSILAREISQEIESQSFDANTSTSNAYQSIAEIEKHNTTAFENITMETNFRSQNPHQKSAPVVSPQTIASEALSSKENITSQMLNLPTLQCNQRPKTKTTKQSTKKLKPKVTRKQTYVKNTEAINRTTKKDNSSHIPNVSLPSPMLNSAKTSKEDKTRNAAKKPRYTNQTLNNITSTAKQPPVVSLTPTVRVQPRIASGNVICTTAKINNNNNQSMVLIPVNAYVRPGAGNHINQSMGLAFAVQAHSLTSNVGTVIPIRNNTVVTGACQQQLIILNSSYSQAGMTSCTNLPSTKQSINTTIVYPPNMATATISQQSSTKHLTTTTQSKSILLKNNTTNIVLTPPPTSNNVRKIQKHTVNNQTVMLNAPSNASTGNVTSAISNAHSSTSQQSTNVVDSTPAVKSDSRYKIHSIVDEHDKLKQVVNQLSQTSGGILSTSKKSPRSRNSSIVIPPALTGSSGSLIFSPTNKKKDSPTQTDKSHLNTSANSVKGSPTSSKSGTVHWNQTSTGPEAPPLVPRNPYGGIGGQTSNMLFCRRISPSLNHTQHVIVGRLGSLGRLGIPRLTVTDIQERNPHLYQTAGPENSVYSTNRNITKSEKPTAYIQLTKEPLSEYTSISSDTKNDLSTTTTVSTKNDLPVQNPKTRHSTRKCEHKVTLTDPDSLSQSDKISTGINHNIPCKKVET